MLNQRRRARLSPKALKAKAISLAVATCFSASVSANALANPTGPSVVSGSAIFSRHGNLLAITNSPGAIINWRDFSIAPSEITRFIQQSAASSVLNRVIGVDPSIILGALQSNGRVFLINPSGILFGMGAQIDVAGLVASTLNLSNSDFLAGRLRFTDVAGAGSLVNRGAIKTRSGGQVYLIAPNVQNHGIVTSAQGDVILAGGKSVELVDPGTAGLRVVIAAPDNEVLNVGQIIANSGKIGIYAGLIRNSGVIKADSVIVGQNGEILIKATKNVTLESGSLISASGSPGGVKDGGTVKVVAQDTLDFRSGAFIRVDGGSDGGNGGFLELSGHNRILLGGTYSGHALAPGFTGGTLLFDPADIDIVFPGPCSVSLCLDPTPVTGDFFGFTDFIADATNNLRVLSPIVNASLNFGNPAGSLTLNAGNDLTVSAPIGSAATRFDHALTMQAGNNIIINDSIFLRSRTLRLAADATIPSVGAVSDGVGDVMIFPTSGPIVVDTLGSIVVSGVDFNIGTDEMAFSTVVTAGQDLVVNVTDNLRIQAGARTTLGDSSVLVAAGNNMTINAGGEVEVTAGEVEFSTTGIGEMLANATLSAGGDVQITAGSVSLKGGSISVTESGGTAIGIANAQLIAGRDLIITSGGLEVGGGLAGVEDDDPPTTIGAMSNGGTAVASAIGRVSAGRDVLVTVTGGIVEIESGNVGNEFIPNNPIGGTPRPGAISNGGTATGSTNAELSAGRDLTMIVNGAQVLLEAGDAGASAGASPRTGTAIATSNVLLSAARHLNVTVDGGSFELYGGESGAITSGAGAARAETNTTMRAGGNASLTVSGNVSICGGNVAGSPCDVALGTGAASSGSGAVASAIALMESGTLNVNTNGDVLMVGGLSSGNGSSHASIRASGPINLTIGGPTGLTLIGSSTRAVGTGSSASPITITFTGGGTKNIINHPALNGTFIQTFDTYTIPDAVQIAINSIVGEINRGTDDPFEGGNEANQAARGGPGTGDKDKEELRMCR